MRYPLDELLDKTSIIRLKFERLNPFKDPQKWADELKKYALAIEEYIDEGICTLEQIENWSKRLYEINGKIWDLEADIRKGKDEELGMEEIGRRAIKIRENNRIRIMIKNEIVEKIGQGFKDIKKDHISQD